jgi:hypothetical protein
VTAQEQYSKLLAANRSQATENKKKNPKPSTSGK